VTARVIQAPGTTLDARVVVSLLGGERRRDHWVDIGPGATTFELPRPGWANRVALDPDHRVPRRLPDATLDFVYVAQP
jgi:hypothetical protein